MKTQEKHVLLLQTYIWSLIWKFKQILQSSFSDFQINHVENAEPFIEKVIETYRKSYRNLPKTSFDSYRNHCFYLSKPLSVIGYRYRLSNSVIDIVSIIDFWPCYRYRLSKT